MSVNTTPQEIVSSPSAEAEKPTPKAATGMGSITDLYKALKETNNTALNQQIEEDRAYFECSLEVIQKDFPSLSIQKIGENLLLLVNPTPALKTIRADLDDYKEGDDLKKLLKAIVLDKKEKPFVLVVDCKNDSFNNTWLQQLVKDLHDEIEQGAFILIQISGLKDY